MDKKHPAKSKTVWFGTAVGLLSTLLAAYPQYSAQLEALFGPRVFGYVGLVVSIGTLVLRFLTKQGVSTK